MSNKVEGGPTFFGKDTQNTEEYSVLLGELIKLNREINDPLVGKVIKAIEGGHSEAAKILCWNEADKFRSIPQAIEVISNGLFSVQELSPWGLSEKQKEDRLKDEEFIGKYRERFADELDDVATKPGVDNDIFSLELGEVVRSGEKIKGSDEIERIFDKVGKNLRLQPDEINKLKERFLG